MRNLVRAFLPSFLLEYYRKYKKKRRNNLLELQRTKGEVLTKDFLKSEFTHAGIVENDVLLVHASLSRLGYVENGPKDVVDALLECLGPNGHLLMPTSPNASFQLDYARGLKEFDVIKSESKLGALSEYFRKLPAAKRSAHPTEPVSCIGTDADFFVQEHFGCLTPYTEKSPFYKVAQRNGKILYLGVTLSNAGTNLHVLEDVLADFKFPVYFDQVFDVQIRFADNTVHSMKTLVHNPEQSKLRKCDELIPLFERYGALKKVKIGQADSLLVDAKAMLEIMVQEYNQNGVTMYTPQGS